MKKNLLKKVLLNVVLGGTLLLLNFGATGAEAAEISGSMNADDIAEPSTVSGILHLYKGELKYTLTNNSYVIFTGATKMAAAVNGGNIWFNVNVVVTNAEYINGENNQIGDNFCTVTLQGGTLTKKIFGEGNLKFAGDVSTNANNIATTGTNTVASGVTLTLNSGILTKGIVNNGIVKLAGATLGGNNLVTTGTLEFA